MLKTFEKSVFLGFIFTILISMINFSGKCDGVSEKILRFHILANSDTVEDQDLKIKVRDRILSYCSSYFDSGIVNKEGAEEVLKGRIEDIRCVAQDEIKCNGYNYPVNVTIQDMYFGTRQYQDTTMPSGKYRALRVEIGEAKGHNWWCVMFPPMCLPAAQEREELCSVLNDGEMDIVENECEYEVKFKLLEIFNGIRDLLNNIF